MIYKKIKKAKEKASLLKMNAMDAVQKGAKGTGIDLDPDKGEDVNLNLKKVANPITMSASASSPLTFNTFVSQGRVNLGETSGEYFKRLNQEIKDGQLGNIEVPKAISGGEAGKSWEDTMKDMYKKGASIQDLVDKGHGTVSGFTNLFKDVQRGAANATGKNIEEFKFVPDPNKQVDVPASQQYNMGEKAVEDANTARGRMRRGLNRDERKAIKNKVQGMTNTERQAFKDNMKKQRKGTFLGLGIGGDRQERKIQALKDMNVEGGKQYIDPNYKSYKQRQSDAILDMDSEENKSKIESATMNKYNFGINDFGDFKPGSSKSVAPGTDPNLKTITADDLKTNITKMTEEEMAEYVKNRLGKKPPGVGKHYQGKSAGKMKSMFGRGPGYKN